MPQFDPLRYLRLESEVLGVPMGSHEKVREAPFRCHVSCCHVSPVDMYFQALAQASEQLDSKESKVRAPIPGGPESLVRRVHDRREFLPYCAEIFV